MKKFIVSLGELLICPAILLAFWYGERAWNWAVGFPSPDDQLVIAAMTDDRKMFNEMLSAGASVNAHASSGFTPLIAAARANRIELTKRLLEMGAQVDEVDQTGQTALGWAQECGSHEVIALLKSHGATPQRKSLPPLSNGAEFVALERQ